MPVHPSDDMSPTEAAAAWLVLNDAGALSPADAAAFAQWLALPQNREAYDAAVAAWGLFDDQEGKAALAALRDDYIDETPNDHRRWKPIAAALTACAVTGAVVTLGLSWSQRQASSMAQKPTEVASQEQNGQITRYATQKGQQRIVTLPDGSTVTLNTNTAIAVAYQAGRRSIHLLRGQALFEVRKDRARPFVVQAANEQVTALGTIFEVRMDSKRLHVLQVEGHVVVDHDQRARPLAGNEASAPTILKPGDALILEQGKPQRLERIDVTKQLLWCNGFVEFNDEPLGDAVAEINRYAATPIVLHDAELAKLRISGVFRTGDPGRFTSLVAELLPVTVRTLSNNQLELTRKS